jgi:hypothetical protein
MRHVYLLSEDDFDDQVYVLVLEALLATRVERLPMRLRRGGGVGEVRKKLPLLLSVIRRTGPLDDTAFVVAIDNDRALEHPSHAPQRHSRDEPCRDCALTDAICAGMPDGRPIPGAIALPVQMIESWLLLMHDAERYPAESRLPPCARRDGAAARELFGATPPPQLKDLVDFERGTSSKADFAVECVLRLDPASLAARSPSFARFREQVAAWATA